MQGKCFLWGDIRMDDLVYLVYPGLLGILLYGCRLAGRGSFHETGLSAEHMKSVQGFAALCIVLHHISQKTSASWLKKSLIIPGLELFVSIGYLLVGIFLFCSGYGLYKSLHTKENYFKGFLPRRILPIAVAGYLVNWSYLILRIVLGEEMSVGRAVCYFTGIKMCNTNGWFVYALPFLYLGFYLAFRFFGRERTALLMLSGWVFLYLVIGTNTDHNDWLFTGEWWYNSILAFPVGVVFAKLEGRALPHLKKHYVLYLLAALLLFLPLFFLGEAAQSLFSYYGENFGADHIVLRRWCCLLAQTLVLLDFLLLVVLLVLKVRFHNALLTFLGGITLELYLVHGPFVELLSRAPLGFLPKVWFCENLALYVGLVLVISVPLAILLKRLGAPVKGFCQQDR